MLNNKSTKTYPNFESLQILTPKFRENKELEKAINILDDWKKNLEFSKDIIIEIIIEAPN